LQLRAAAALAILWKHQPMRAVQTYNTNGLHFLTDVRPVRDHTSTRSPELRDWSTSHLSGHS